MVYFFTILKIYIVLIQNRRKSFIGLSIKLSSMQQSNKTAKSIQEEDLSENDENMGEDGFTPSQLQELELEKFIMKELDATLEFKEKLEEYVYDNFLPFLKYFNMKLLRNMFM